MEIRVNGEVRELVAIDKNTGIEWTNDLIGNWGDLNWDEGLDAYTMTEEQFRWWEKYIDMLDEIDELVEKLSDEAIERYNAEYFDEYDAEAGAEARLEWLRNEVA